MLILPVNFVILTITQDYRKAVKEQTLSSCEVILNLYMGQLDKEMYSIDTYSNRLLYDADFMRMSEQSGNSKYVLARNSLYVKFTENMNFHILPVGIFIYTPVLNNITIAVSNEKKGQRDKLAEYFKNSEFLDGYIRWKFVEIEGSKFLLHAFKLGGIYYGGFIFLDDLVNNILNELDYVYKEIVLDDIYSDSVWNNLQVTVKSQSEELYLHLMINENEIYKKLPFLKKLLYAFSLASFILIPILYYILRRMLLRPLKRIDDALRRLENGEKDYRIGRHKYALEFLHINQSFNDMADQIESLKTENLKQELIKNRMELHNLQLQIRPHFLLNNFNMMYNMAQLKDYTGIQKMLVYLSQYFRYIFRNGKELQKLKNELSVVKAYLDVADLRYNNCFIVNYEIEEEALDIELPPLILYNFVENIIKHAVQVDKVVNITIRSEITPEWIRIIIEDDGQGMDQKILECIRSGEPVEKNDGQHIGIWNSRYRLKTFCSNEADIEVFSEFGKGTKVIIKLPWNGG